MENSFLKKPHPYIFLERAPSKNASTKKNAERNASTCVEKNSSTKKNVSSVPKKNVESDPKKNVSSAPRKNVNSVPSTSVEKSKLSEKPTIERKRSKRPKGYKPFFKRLKPKGLIFVHNTDHNTIITLTDLRGNVKRWASAGSCGFKKSRRSGPYAAQVVGEKIGKEAILAGLRVVHVQLKGKSKKKGGKKLAVKGLSRAGVRIARIIEATPIPHNGCRLSQKRRK